MPPRAPARLGPTRLALYRYNSYNGNITTYDGSNGYAYTPNVMTFDVRSTVDFVDSTTAFDQQHTVADSMPDACGLLTPAISPSSSGGIFHLGTCILSHH